MNKHRRFFLNDTVKYVGAEHSRLSRKNAWGRVVGYVKDVSLNGPKETVVEFADASYVVQEDDLAPYRFAEKEEFTVDVQRISRKWDTE